MNSSIIKCYLLVFCFLSIQLLNAQPIKQIKKLGSITFYERTSNTFTHTFQINSPELNTRLNNPLTANNQDFSGARGEYFDVYFSDADGSFNEFGNYISVEAVWPVTSSGGGLNLIAVEFNFTDGNTIFANHLESYFANGSNYNEGSEVLAVDCNLNTWSTLGNTSGINQNLRLTLGLENTYSEFFLQTCAGDNFSIEVNGTIYDENNPQGLERMQNRNACDSLIVINLDFQDEENSSFEYQGCAGDGFSIEINGTTYDESNPVGMESLISSAGCDSIVSVFLIFQEEINTNFSYTGCIGDEFSIDVNGTVYNENNPRGTETLRSTLNCDSLVSIQLIFNDCSVPQLPCDIYIPNVFSPNKDGINDCFEIYSSAGCNFNDFSIQVFNRWGGLVFQSEDPNFCWEGLLNGESIASGAYVWLVQYTAFNDRQEQLSGSLLLMN